jgi:DNA-binding NarL/FixJ family response regulator
MDTVLQALAPTRPSGQCESLPARMKVLYVTTLHRTGGWLAEAFASDSASEVRLQEEVGATAGLARLRDEVFDAVLMAHDPPGLDALKLIEGLRAGGAEEPMVVLGSQPSQEMAPLCYEVGADAYCAVASTTTRSLIWFVARAMERHQLIRENRRLVEADRQRLRLEHQEAERLLGQQRSLVADLEALQDGAIPDLAAPPSLACDGPSSDDLRSASPPLPDRLVHHYRELLRAHIIMGTGNLTSEMTALAEVLTSAGVTAPQTMQLHLHVVEQVVHGLGNRSARHVLNRADLLILEVMAQLAEGYRQRWNRRVRPPEQVLLPGFEC